MPGEESVAEEISRILGYVGDFVWGPPMLVLLVGTGIFLTFRLRGLQFTALGHSLWLALVKRREEGADGDISHFQALMTALSATVGTGNIAGVATAIAAGGPGALFWMWITGLFGMATKFAEAVLAVRFRITDSLGTKAGGPMYYLAKGLKWGPVGPILGGFFAVAAAIAAFGIGNMVQSNSVAVACESQFGISPYVTGIVLAVATALVILGGIKSIGRVTSVLVPVMIVIYVGGALVILALQIGRIPEIFALVIRHAFSPTSAVGGFAGATVRQTIRMGVARGVFSNESGLGSSPIAAAAAMTHTPTSQALVSMTQTFIDTIVICSMTGFVILVSGAWTTDGLDSSALTAAAFSAGLPGRWGGIIVALGLVLFAYSTILGWSYYGEKALEYLAGTSLILPYRILWCLLLPLGATVKITLVWSFSDVMNGLMALPNLVGLLVLSGLIAKEARSYFLGRNREQGSGAKG